MQGNNSDITDFILTQVELHPQDIVACTARQFGISRQRAHTYVARLVLDGQLIKTGSTRDSRYYSRTGKIMEFRESIRPHLAEDRMWTQYVKPMLTFLPENVYRICQYGFTEIYNNAIDHSEGTVIYTRVEKEEESVVMTIMDNGVGIFEKIQRALHLDSPRESILHLAKGKFTTDPEKHSGEGLFFTSRMFDSFSILSSEMYYTFHDNDWFLSNERREDVGRGTYIRMSISAMTEKTTQGVFDQFADVEIGFGKTIVAVRLSADSDDPHVSRSQAKRLLMGLDRFQHVVLDFERVDIVGQAFVDEVFRVFQNAHPHIKIDTLHASRAVTEMIRRVRATT